ncbi:hypothetical protein K1I93_09260 [Streptococcus australis]|uniref:hypothetical protein n=1 Tax=Streptococcus australis TaxID=113107 RepID=UPI001CBECB92|nr:hypothetical protein [Streptococcus australis]MBZ2160238.1 hypothetical protein [Streptococcus australis]
MKYFKKYLLLKWYYQLTIALTSLVLIALLIKFLIWVVPIILGILALLFFITEGEIFTMLWEEYKKSKQPTISPICSKLYDWLSEEGVSELPLNTKKFLQGIEYATPDIFYVHLKETPPDKTLENFETNVRQQIKVLSQENTDGVVSIVEQEPFLAIKVRLTPASEVQYHGQHFEEDF